jgi:hypothetical protein
MSTNSTTQEADLFWDDADTEQSATDISDILDNYCSGEIVRVQRAVRRRRRGLLRR